MKEYQFEKLMNSPGGRQLRQFVQEHLGDSLTKGDFASFERGLHAAVTALERDLLQEELQKYNVSARRIEVEGVEYRNVLSSQTETYLSAAGPITVERDLFARSGGGRAVCPLELQVGIIGGLWTPLAARQAAFAVAHMTPHESESLFREIGGMAPSHASIDRLPKFLSDVWESQRRSWEEALRAQDPLPAEAVLVAISLDGVMIPMKDAEEGKTPAPSAVEADAKAGYREAACGTVSLFDQEGTRLETVRYARMPESKKVTLAEQLTAEYESIRVGRPDLTLVKIADGAEENWRIMTEMAPDQGVEIVDFYHSAEHLKAGLDLYHGQNTPQSRAEFERLKVILKEVEGGADQVLRALKYRHDRTKSKGRKKKLAQELTFFRRQRERMDYPRYLEEGLPIGSGVVEAACKSLVSTRCKRSGMAWSIRGGQGILTLRALLQSERWEDGWILLAGGFKKTVEVVSRKEERTLRAVA